MADLNGEMPSEQWHSRLQPEPLWVVLGDKKDQYVCICHYTSKSLKNVFKVS